MFYHCIGCLTDEYIGLYIKTRIVLVLFLLYYAYHLGAIAIEKNIQHKKKNIEKENHQ